MTKREEAEVLVKHHLDDFDKYVEDGYMLAAMLSLWDVHEVLRELPPEDLRPAWSKWAKEIHRRVKAAAGFPSHSRRHKMPALPFFGSALRYGF
jgi:hypothetical protein